MREKNGWARGSIFLLRSVSVQAGAGVSLLLPFPPRHRAVVRRAILIRRSGVVASSRGGSFLFFFGWGGRRENSELGRARSADAKSSIAKSKFHKKYRDAILVNIYYYL